MSLDLQAAQETRGTYLCVSPPREHLGNYSTLINANEAIQRLCGCADIIVSPSTDYALNNRHHSTACAYQYRHLANTNEA